MLTSLQVSLPLLFSPAKGVILLKLKAEHVTSLLKTLDKVLVTLQSSVKSASHPDPNYYLLLFFIHSVLAIPDRIHQVCLSTLELFPLPGMFSPQVLMWLTPPLLSLCLSIILKKVHPVYLILKCHIFPRNSGFPLTLLHFSKHFLLTILYYSLLPSTRRGAHKGKIVLYNTHL